MTRINVHETTTRRGVVRALDLHPKLASAVHDIAVKAQLPDAVVREHLDAAVLEVLEVLGTSYVREMGEAIGRLQRLRETVHSFYERVLTGAERSPDPAGLRDTMAALQREIHNLVSPEEWARRKAEQAAADPLAGLAEFDPAAARPRTAAAGGTPAAVAGAPATPEPAPGPRWARDRDVRRYAALPQRLQRALDRARRVDPGLVDAVARGDDGAVAALRAGLRRSGLSAAQSDAAVAAATAVRAPDLAYALGGRSAGARPGGRPAHAAFRDLPSAQQDAVRAAAAADPEFVRSMVTAEIGYGEPRGRRTPWRPEEMNQFCAEHGIDAAGRAELEAALIQLNAEHRTGLRTEAAEGTAGGTRRSAAERAAALDDVAAGLGLPPTGKIADQLAGSGYLRDIATRSPEQFLDLAAGWLENAERRAAQGKPVPSLRRYVLGIMRTQVRGLVGELTAVFRLGRDVWVLKAPDLRVTDPGTDFVVVLRANGEIWFCDNKALSDAGLSRVSSLVENIGQNMADDVAEFGPEIDRARVPVPTGIADAVAHARTAASQIGQLLSGLTPEDRASQEIQVEVTRICDRNGVRRVVTNSGGQLSTLSAELAQLGIDLANLEQAVPVHPTRPLTSGGPTTGTGGTTGGTSGEAGGTP